MFQHPEVHFDLRSGPAFDGAHRCPEFLRQSRVEADDDEAPASAQHPVAVAL
jgi:hypothetical protein